MLGVIAITLVEALELAITKGLCCAVPLVMSGSMSDIKRAVYRKCCSSVQPG